MLCLAALPLQAAPSDLSPDSNLEADLDFVVRTLSESYAGFPDKTEGAAGEEFAYQVALARERMRARPDARIHALDALLDWFGDQHLAIRSKIVSPSDPWPSEDQPPRKGAVSNLSQEFKFVRLSDETVMIRVPDFSRDNAKKLAELLEANHKAITTTPNLIIDARFNGGGADDTYAPLMAYIYTRPIYAIGVELRKSPRNLAYLKGLVGKEGMPESVRQMAAEILSRARAIDGEWVSLNESGFSITTYPQVYEYPRRVGILAEGAGSSGDQFALDARFSRKVTLLGGPTAGIIDYSNVIGVDAPSGEFTLRYPMTRSQRLPDEPIDNVGVPADVVFGDEVEDHIAAAQEWLERQVD